MGRKESNQTKKNIENKILSETTRPKALIFGMLQNLVGLYQVCSNYDTMAKMAQS